MSFKFSDNADLQRHELLNAVLEKSATDVANQVAGQVSYRTDINRARINTSNGLKSVAYTDDTMAPSAHTHVVANITDIDGAVTTILTDDLTSSRVVISNASGKVAVSDITVTELGYLDGVTSNIQTQLNNKMEGGYSSTAPVSVISSSGTARAGVATTAMRSDAQLKLTASSVNTADIANVAVTNAKIADSAVTNAKMDSMATMTVKANITESAASPSDVSLSTFGDTLMGAASYMAGISTHGNASLTSLNGVCTWEINGVSNRTKTVGSSTVYPKIVQIFETATGDQVFAGVNIGSTGNITITIRSGSTITANTYYAVVMY